MMKYILCPNVNRDTGLALTLEMKGLLERNNIKTVICPVFDGTDENDIPNEVKTSDINSEIGDADMIVVFGGDGTILKAARAAAGSSCPIIGINTGDKGFMAELEQNEMTRVLETINGDFTVRQRMMIDVEVHRGSEIVYSDFALNDSAVRGLVRVVDISVYGDGELISHFTGDGAVAATPTGSTAYSMSAGGPIVEPSAENIIITPICAHALAAKSFVLAPDRNVVFEIGRKKTNPVILVVDGGDGFPLCPGDRILIRKSRKTSHFVHISERSFYKTVSEKLGERT